MKILMVLGFVTVVGSHLFAREATFNPEPTPVRSSSIDYYQNRYGLKDVYQKKVDNHGNGYDTLYGVRNFRAVLNGVVFRGGANNRYNRYHRRPNQSPLEADGLKNLCEEGFGQAVYLYSTRFQAAPKAVSCIGRDGEPNELRYMSIEPLSSPDQAHDILTIVQKALTGEDQRPIYLHCWNGWHASGFISALSLRQFCGWTGEQAVNYWIRNTDGNERGHRAILKRIRAYKPDSSLAISEELQQRVCPLAPRDPQF